MYAAVALLALPLALAIQILSPATGDMWGSGTASQTITWEAVDTDPSSFEVQLVNQAGYLTNSPVTLISSQDRGSANTQVSATVTYPSGTWPTGSGFQINFMSTSSNAGILAQSGQFNISSTGSVSTTSSGSSTTSASTNTPTTLSKTSTAGSAVTVTSTSGSSNSSSGDASGGIPNASTSSKSSGGITSMAAPAAGGLLAVVALVATIC